MKFFLLFAATLVSPNLDIEANSISGKRAPDQPPNIVYILADDLGYNELGCYGQKWIRTPNVDRIAKEGLKFTQHYSGNAVCAPSRCSLMTGKHQGHSYIRGNGIIMIGPIQKKKQMKRHQLLEVVVVVVLVLAVLVIR